jgi:hypothetical protein
LQQFAGCVCALGKWTGRGWMGRDHRHDLPPLVFMIGWPVRFGTGNNSSFHKTSPIGKF